MEFTTYDLYRGAMINARVRIEYKEQGQLRSEVVEIVGVSADFLRFRRGLNTEQIDIAFANINKMERIHVDMQANVERIREFCAVKEKALRNGRMDLRQRFGLLMETLREQIAQCEGCSELCAFLNNNSALAGDIKRQPMEAVCAQAEAVSRELPEELACFMNCLIALASRDAVGAMKAYLRGPQTEIDDEFVKKYAAQLAVASLQLDSRYNYDCAFVYWIDRLLQKDPDQVLTDQVLWLHYLKACVIFQHFGPMCAVLRSRVSTKPQEVYDAAAYVFALNEMPLQACEALEGLRIWERTGRCDGMAAPIGSLLIHLIDDAHSFCVRYAERVNMMIELRDIGRETQGYIYDYVDLRPFARVVSGWLVSYFIHQQDIAKRLKDNMKERLEQGLDYEPELVSFKVSKGRTAVDAE